MITLRDYQQEAHDSSINHMKLKVAPDRPAIVKATVAAGKSMLIAAAAMHVSDRGGRVLCLSRQGELTEQNSDAATAYGCRNSIYSASLNLKSTFYPVVMATEGTAARALNEPGFTQRFDLILIDEMQMVNYDDESSQFMKIIRHCQRINPKVRILGYSGSPYRGTDSAIGAFWKDTVCDISTELLTDKGFLTPLHFGCPDSPDEEIDFSNIQLKEDHNGNDYSEEDIDKILQGEVDKTFAICADVVAKTSSSTGTLIFTASKLHTKQVKYGLEMAGVSADKIRIVTDDTPKKERQEARRAAISGECLYFINVGVCATGWDVPRWQHLVFMRPVASLVFLIQTIGRVLRVFLDDEAREIFNDRNTTIEQRMEIIKAGDKPYSVVHDYAGVMDRLGHLYNNPMLEQAALEKSKKEGKTIECPKCATENSEHARRCIGQDFAEPDGRCGHFWSSQSCRKCGTLNDQTAQECRSCKAMLRDPANALMHKAYTDAELVPVKKMEVVATRNGGVLIKYLLDEPHEELGHPEQFFNLSTEGGKRGFYNEFLKLHIRDSQWRYRVRGMTNEAVMKNQAMFDVPTHIAYRINDKKKFRIGRKLFLSGRLEE